LIGERHSRYPLLAARVAETRTTTRHHGATCRLAETPWPALVAAAAAGVVVLSLLLVVVAAALLDVDRVRVRSPRF